MREMNMNRIENSSSRIEFVNRREPRRFFLKRFFILFFLYSSFKKKQYLYILRDFHHEKAKTYIYLLYYKTRPIRKQKF